MKVSNNENLRQYEERLPEVPNVQIEGRAAFGRVPLECHVMRHGLVTTTGGGACALHASFRFVTVPFPPVQATHKFFDSKAKLGHA